MQFIQHLGFSQWVEEAAALLKSNAYGSPNPKHISVNALLHNIDFDNPLTLCSITRA